jgi:Tfp pilus assembly protein PilZ
MPEKRTSRIRVRFREGKDFTAVWQRDLSHGGIFLRTNRLRPLRSTLIIVLCMPDGSDIEIRGEVVHVVKAEEASAQNPMGIAVQLTALDEKMRKRLEAYLVDLKRRTLEPQSEPLITPPPVVAPLPDDKSLLRRVCWLLADGNRVSERAIEAVCGLPRDASLEARRAVLDRLRHLLSPEQPPEYLGWSDARAITRLLSELEARLLGSGGH